MQRNAVTTAKRQLPDVTANYIWNSLVRGNAATPPPPGLLGTNARISAKSELRGFQSANTHNKCGHDPM